MTNTKRWTVMNKKTGTTVGSYNTRDAARGRKRTMKNGTIFDNVTSKVVR